jgi:small GTP-binding protein
MGERVCKILFLGDPEVGKTALFHRITRGAFWEEASSTLGADFATKTWPVADKTITLQIWDTAGQERFHAMGTAFYRGTDACAIVFDLTRRRTFEHVAAWQAGLEQKIGARRGDGFPLVLLANKADLAARREVSFDEAAAFGSQHGFAYFEVSAKTEENLPMVLNEIATRFVEARRTEVTKVIRPVEKFDEARLACC